MELLNWLAAGLDPSVARAVREDAQIFAVGFCPFTGCHWIVEDQSPSPAAMEASRPQEGLRSA